MELTNYARDSLLENAVWIVERRRIAMRFARITTSKDELEAWLT